MAKPAAAEADSGLSDQQHKHVSILFADICGSTALIAEMDAEKADETLSGVLAVLGEQMRRFGGIVARQMGDGVLVLFGAPVATEDHAVRACLAALAAREAVQAMGAGALPVRFGINSGPVVLRKTGPAAEDLDVAGMAVHIAARLESHADPDTILISSETSRLAGGIATTETIGKVSLKGIAEPVEAHLLLAATDRSSWAVRSRGAVLSDFVGREREFAFLDSVLAQALCGRMQAVALIAEAGMGKSRLLHQLVATRTPGEWQVLRVETTARSAAVPYFLAIALLREMVGAAETATASEIAGALPATLAKLALAGAVDLQPLLTLLDPEQTDSVFETMGPGPFRRLVAATLRAMVMRRSEMCPLIVIVEDYHWLDSSSLALLSEMMAEMMEARSGLRLALLVTARPDRRPGWPEWSGATAAAEPGCVAVTLAALSPAQADALLCGLIGGSSRLEPLRAQILGRADGTPLFLEEFSRSLHEAGTMEAAAADLSTVVIPPSIQSILAARIDRLPAPHRRVLQIAAVIGRDVPTGLLCEVGDQSAQALQPAMTALHSAAFVLADADNPGLVRFAHALTHSVAYESLLRRDRRTLHARVLQALQRRSEGAREVGIDQLVHHAHAAEAWADAAVYGLKAGEQAIRHAAFVEAKAFLEIAIDDLRRAPVGEADLGVALDARLRLRNVVESMQGDAVPEDYRRRYLADTDAIAEQMGGRVHLARANVGRAVRLSHCGEIAVAIELSRRTLAVSLETGDSLAIVSSAFALALAQKYGGEWRQARDMLVENLPHARSEAGRQRDAATFVLPVAVYLCFLSRIEHDLGYDGAAWAALEEARAAVAQDGHAFDQILVDTTNGALLLGSGAVADSARLLERALGQARATRNTFHIPGIASVLGTAYVRLGRHAEARDLLVDASALADRSRYAARRLDCSPPLVRALAEGDDADLSGAIALAQRCIAEASARGLQPVVVKARIALGRALMRCGAWSGAIAAIEPACVLAAEIGLARDAVEAQALLAEAARGCRAKPARCTGG